MSDTTVVGRAHTLWATVSKSWKGSAGSGTSSEDDVGGSSTTSGAESRRPRRGALLIAGVAVSGDSPPAPKLAADGSDGSCGNGDAGCGASAPNGLAMRAVAASSGAVPGFKNACGLANTSAARLDSSSRWSSSIRASCISVIASPVSAAYDAVSAASAGTGDPAPAAAGGGDGCILTMVLPAVGGESPLTLRLPGRLWVDAAP
mmetsp:Transcript_22404/g.69504  ORF Transcript_22404/g.69504 Transcript_22404/m.69504 type:complete len:204 (+) Transcript_22404:641-1252(+)